MAKIKPIINDDTAKEPIQAFLARTTEPPKDNSNLNYRLTSAGGYNPCVRGGYSNGRRNPAGALPNCFSGDTKVITDKGIFTLKELCGTFHNVLTEDGTFHEAEFKCYGKQSLYRITLNNGQSFRVTGNHRWIVYHKSYHKDSSYFKRVEKTTLELNRSSDMIRYVKRGALDSFEYDDYGFLHGLMFGDGTSRNRLPLIGNKQRYFNYIPKEAVKQFQRRGDCLEVLLNVDRDLKQFPSLDESVQYLRGFFLGYLLTDGCISRKNGATVSSVSQENLRNLKQLCSKILIRTFEIRCETRNITLGKYNYESHKLYRLGFDFSCICGLPFVQENPVKVAEFTRIKSIEPLNEVEDVYCCEEPVTHTMVLDGHILTGQCVGYVWGRWREVLGYNHNLPYGNAKTIYRDALARGFSGSTNIPRIGSIIVWGGGTYGHVGVVESIEPNGDIWVSDSNYGSVWFRYYKRYRKNGYRSLGGKSLIGFVYLPITFLDNGGFVIDSVNGDTNKSNVLANLGSSIVGGTTIYYTNIEKSVNAMVETRNKAQQSKDTSDNATDIKPTTPGGVDKDKADIYDDIRNNESTREEDKKIMKGSYVEFSHSSVYAGTGVSDKGYLLKDTYLQYIWNVDDVAGNRVLIGWNTKNNLRLNKWVNISDCILVPSNILNSTILKKVTNEQGAKVYLNENILNISLSITTLPMNTIVNVVIGSYKNNTYKILLNDTLRNKYSKLYGYVLAEDVDTKTEKRGQTL